MVLEASLEVRGSVVYATFVVALVFVPVLLLSGVQGALFRPLGLAYIFATLASLAVALTVTPALTLMLLVRRERPAPVRPGCWAGSSGDTAWRSSWGVRHAGPVGLGAAVICLLALAALPFFGATFLPEFREGHYLVHMSAVPGTSLDESLRSGPAGHRRAQGRPTHPLGGAADRPGGAERGHLGHQLHRVRGRTAAAEREGRRDGGG